MAEGTGLENRRTGNRFVSSNLTLSVTTALGSRGVWTTCEEAGAEVCIALEVLQLQGTGGRVV